MSRIVLLRDVIIDILYSSNNDEVHALQCNNVPALKHVIKISTEGLMEFHFKFCFCYSHADNVFVMTYHHVKHKNKLMGNSQKAERIATCCKGPTMVFFKILERKSG